MMILVANELLDFDGMIEVEKQVKLFEDISTTDGDFSYAFDLQKTINNQRLLQNPLPDNISKPVYQRIPAKILSESGAENYDGYIRVERITDVYQCSFFAGNNNWFGMLSGKLSELDFSEYDTPQTESSIHNAIFNTEGVVFPLVDNGGLLTRSFALIKVEEFVAGIYVKTVFDKIFASHGIKVKGELLNDSNFQSAITLRSGRSQTEIDSNSTFAEKSATSTRVSENVQYKMTFQNDSVAPYFDGGNFDISTSTYYAPVKVRVDIEVNLVPSIVDNDYNNRIYLWINGSYPGFVDIGLDAGGLYNSASPGDDPVFTLKRTITLEAGSTLEIASEWQQSVGSTQNDVLSGSVRITPTFIYYAFGNSIVPNWTQQQYVSNILRLFNVLASYKEQNQTLTLNLFEKIRSKPVVDISQYISETEVDYTEFVSEYGKKSLISFKELSEELSVRRFEYQKGVVPVDNEFLPDEVDVLESDFTNPIGYINRVFDMSMERTNLVSLETDNGVECTGVTDSIGQARFAIADDIFLLSDMVRITDSTNPIYNGDWMVDSLGTGYIELAGLNFDTDATCTITKLKFAYKQTEDVFILHHVPLYSVPNFSGLSTIQFENTDLGTMAPAFFNLLNTGRQINRDFLNSMSFSGEDNERHYQQTLIQQYFRLFAKILNDPVKLYQTAHLPYSVYQSLDFLRPVKIQTFETTNVYYLNRITGYKESFLPCTLELIKI
jgi:hypothetical protein